LPLCCANARATSMLRVQDSEDVRLAQLPLLMLLRSRGKRCLERSGTTKSGPLERSSAGACGHGFTVPVSSQAALSVTWMGPKRLGEAMLLTLKVPVGGSSRAGSYA
jgi:hypothetical protein